jgi:hypothetical protein
MTSNDQAFSRQRFLTDRPTLDIQDRAFHGLLARHREEVLAALRHAVGMAYTKYVLSQVNRSAGAS